MNEMRFAWRPTKEITMNSGHNNRVKTCLAELIALVLVFLLRLSCLASEPSNSRNAQSPARSANHSSEQGADARPSAQNAQNPASAIPGACAQPTPQVDAQTLPQWQGSDLHKAISRQDLVALRKLLKQKADPNEKDNYENTPLLRVIGPIGHEAKPKPREVILREIEKEARFKMSAAEELLKYGADPNIRGIRGLTPLIRVAWSWYGPRRTIRILTLLTDYKADVNLRDELGYSALMCAAQAGRPEVVKFLLKHHANAALTNCEGKTALQLAQLYNHTEIVRILQSVK